MPAPSTPVAPSSRWARLLFPSVDDLIFLTLVLSLTVSSLASRLLGDAGIGWHIRNGDLMLHAHAVTRTDPFSSTMAGSAWYAWEWLYDGLIAAVHSRLGLNGVVLFSAVVIAATFACTFRLMLARGGNLPVSVLLLLLAAGAAMIHFLARPHVLSWLFTVAWFQVLDSFEIRPERWRRLFWLPVLMLGWVNLHGGFLMGFALLAIYLLGAFIRWRSAPGAVVRDEGKRSTQRLSVITTLCLGASLVNPYGYKLHVHVYEYLSNRFLMDHIDEFLSPNFHGVAQQCFAVLLVISLIALAVRRKALRPSQLLLTLFAAYSGLYATRNLPVSSIFLSLLAAPWLTQGMQAAAADVNVAPRLRRLFQQVESFSVRMGRVESEARGHLWPVLGCGVCLWIAAHGGMFGGRQFMNAQFDAKRFPVEAVEMIVQQGIRQPIFCPDSWGGFLIYRLYPQTKVVLDDRHDLYGEAFLKNYLKVIHAEPGWADVLDGMHVAWVLAPAGSALSNLLKEVSAWKTVHQDETAILFERVGTEK